MGLGSQQGLKSNALQLVQCLQDNAANPFNTLVLLRQQRDTVAACICMHDLKAT
jgi:hypothetical protein